MTLSGAVADYDTGKPLLEAIRGGYCGPAGINTCTLNQNGYTMLADCTLATSVSAATTSTNRRAGVAMEFSSTVPSTKATDALKKSTDLTKASLTNAVVTAKATMTGVTGMAAVTLPTVSDVAQPTSGDTASSSSGSMVLIVILVIVVVGVLCLLGGALVGGVYYCRATPPPPAATTKEVELGETSSSAGGTPIIGMVPAPYLP